MTKKEVLIERGRLFLKEAEILVESNRSKESNSENKR